MGSVGAEFSGSANRCSASSTASTPATAPWPRWPAACAPTCPSSPTSRSASKSPATYSLTKSVCLERKIERERKRRKKKEEEEEKGNHHSPPPSPFAAHTDREPPSFRLHQLRLAYHKTSAKGTREKNADGSPRSSQSACRSSRPSRWPSGAWPGCRSRASCGGTTGPR